MSFATFSFDELEPGVLWKAFAAGSAAAIIECGDLVEMLWSMLLENPEEKLPWELPLLDVARNHLRGKDLPSTLGDAFYFQPGHHSYISRKFEVDRSGTPQVRPEKFYQGDRAISPNEELVGLCCSFVDRVMLALNPPGKPMPQYNVAVQRLKYQGNWVDFEALTDLVQDSLARWGRRGYSLDVRRSQIGAPFARKGVSDVLALLLMVPGLARLADLIGRRFSKHDERSGSAAHVYEHAHTDYRFFTGLCGWRQNVRTEVLIAGEWLELPVNLKGVAIYPGTMLMGGASVTPTTHRVVHMRSPDEACHRASNVTVLLGAV